MKMMNKIVFGILVGFMFIFSACQDDDGYSLGDIWIGLGILENTDTYTVILDNGDTIVPLAYDYGYPWYYKDHTGERKKFEAGDRVLLNYTVLDDKTNSEGDITTFYVRINSTKKVLMKGILDITPEIEDSIGNDPIIVEEYWVTNNLLNLQLKYWGQSKTHFINLVKQPGDLTKEDQPFELELRHNSNEDPESIPFVSIVSFKLDDLQVAGTDTVTFKVKSTDYDGRTIEVTKGYKYVVVE